MSDDLAIIRAKWLYDVLVEHAEVGVGSFYDGTEVWIDGQFDLVELAKKIDADVMSRFTAPADKPATTDDVP